MKRGFYDGKKGLSPVIASVLLILLVFFLAILIFTWGRGFISEKVEKFGQPIDVICSDVQFDAEIIIEGVETLEVSNRGDIDIYRLEIKLFKGGDAIFRKFSYKILAGGNAKGPINLAMENNDRAESIIIYPALIGTPMGQSSNRVFTCLNMGKEFIL
jgi:flagellin-like protein